MVNPLNPNARPNAESNEKQKSEPIAGPPTDPASSISQPKPKLNPPEYPAGNSRITNAEFAAHSTPNFVGNLLNWLKSLGVGTFLIGGIGMMQDPSLFWWSVALIIVGFVLIATDLYLEPWFSNLASFWKVVVGLLYLGIMALFGRGLVFVPVPLFIGAVLPTGEYPTNTFIAGIAWKPEFSELSVTIINPTRRNYEDLDITLRPSGPIAAIARRSGPDVLLEYKYDAPRFAMIVTGSSTNFGTPYDLIATEVGYRMRCDKLAGGGRIEIVIAIADIEKATGPFDAIMPNADIGAVVSIRKGEGASWFGNRDKTVYKRHQAPLVVQIGGEYTAAQRRHSISNEIPVISPLSLVPADLLHVHN